MTAAGGCPPDREQPLPLPSPSVLRQGSSPVRAETRFRGSVRQSRVEPGRHLPGRSALLSLASEPIEHDIQQEPHDNTENRLQAFERHRDRGIINSAPETTY